MLRPRELLAEVHRRSPVLARTAWLHAALAVVALALMPFDERTILGLSPWSKPFKFMVSIAIYLGTLAWFVHYVRDARRTVRVVAWGVSLAMIVETAALWTQAARGTTSHYNVATAFDTAVAGVMAVMIFVNSLLLLVLAVAFFVRETDLEAPYRWGIRLGLLFIVAGSLEGIVMIANEAHTVGVPDGGPGLPLLNWSTGGGDLRVAHALGLHGLQVLPLAGYLIGRWRARRPAALQLAWLGAFTLVYAALMIGTYLQARAGVPLIRT